MFIFVFWHSALVLFMRMEEQLHPSTAYICCLFGLRTMHQNEMFESCNDFDLFQLQLILSHNLFKRTWSIVSMAGWQKLHDSATSSHHTVSQFLTLLRKVPTWMKKVEQEFFWCLHGITSSGLSNTLSVQCSLSFSGRAPYKFIRGFHPAFYLSCSCALRHDLSTGQAWFTRRPVYGSRILSR